MVLNVPVGNLGVRSTGSLNTCIRTGSNQRMQVSWANSRFFLTLLARTATCPQLQYQVGGVLTKMPSRSQCLRLLVGCVPGGTPRLPGKKNLRAAWHVFSPEMEWRYRFPEINCDTQKHSKVDFTKSEKLTGKTSLHGLIRRSRPGT